MNGTDLQLDQLSEDCLKVLNSYAIREMTSRKSSPDANGWLDRIEDVPGVDPAELTAVHGMLIAQGMLKFEITGRSVGLQYQLSGSGRDALTKSQVPDENTDAGPELQQAQISGAPVTERRPAMAVQPAPHSGTGSAAEPHPLAADESAADNSSGHRAAVRGAEQTSAPAFRGAA